MKNYIFTLLLFLIPLIVFAQPSWLEPYNIPATGQIFQVNDCASLDAYDFNMTQQLDTVDFILYGNLEDSVVYDANGECTAVHRSIDIINWLTADVYDLNMTFMVDANLCDSEMHIDMQGRKEVTVGIQDIVPSGLAADYSFSLTNPDLDSIQLSTSENHRIYTFNHQTNELCLIHLYFTPCGPDFAFEVDPMVSLDMTQDKCATINVQDILLNFNYDCGSYDLGFLENGGISQETVLAYKTNDRQVNRTLIFVSQDQDTLTQTITFSLEATIEPNYTIRLAGDDYYNAGDTGYIEIGGEVQSLLAVTGRFHFNGIKGLHVENIHPNLIRANTSQYNITDDFFAFIWEGPSIHEPKDIPVNEPWFTFHFVAEESGYISDLIDLTTTLYDHIVFSGSYCDALFEQTVEYVFTDNLISSSESPRASSQITAFPNPASDELQIKGWKGSSADIDLFSMDGRKVLTHSYHSSVGSLSVPVHRLADGMYLLQIRDRNGPLTDQKIVVIQH